MAATVRDVMTTDLVACRSTTPVGEAAALMAREDVGDVIVVDDDQLRGIVTDRDIVVRCLAQRSDLSEVTLADAMSQDLVTVDVDTDVSEAARLIREHAVRRLPVLEEGTAVGMVSLGDLAVEEDPGSALADVTAASPT